MASNLRFSERRAQAALHSIGVGRIPSKFRLEKSAHWRAKKRSNADFSWRFASKHRCTPTDQRTRSDFRECFEHFPRHAVVDIVCLKSGFVRKNAMSPSVSQAIPMRRSAKWILGVYVGFAIFGLGLHHWGGSHRHSLVSESQASDCLHHCCHNHDQENSKSDSEPSCPSIESMPSPCEGCQIWWSVVQASQGFEPIESIETLPLVESAMGKTSSFLGATVVVWHSRGPPAL